MDLTKLNILVDPETGVVKRIIDWDDVQTLPLKCGLYALQMLLGTQYVDGWHWHEHKAFLEHSFHSIFGFNLPLLERP